jgi:general secretion pathway protein A
VVITGEIGAGKTTVCRTLLSKLEPSTKVAVITNTHLTCKELIAQLLEELEVEYNPGTKQKLLSQLNHHLIKQLSADVNVVLIIDEAQNLSSKVLEEVRMLSNLETEKEKLIQIILMGQPQLRQKLDNCNLEQFKQRVAVYYHLQGLSRSETQRYILHRLNLVCSNSLDIFTPKAIDAIYENSRGIPRVINLICDSALLSGYVYDNHKITEQVIHNVIKERDFKHAYEEVEQATLPEIKTFCCPDCGKYSNCEIKWDRGTKGENQVCCPSCQDFNRCQDSVKKIKLN